jgi:hypothetical protein
MYATKTTISQLAYGTKSPSAQARVPNRAARCSTRERSIGPKLTVVRVSTLGNPFLGNEDQHV